jgi:hypothetical protein
MKIFDFKIRTWVELLIVITVIAILTLHIITEIDTFYGH